MITTACAPAAPSSPASPSSPDAPAPADPAAPAAPAEPEGPSSGDELPDRGTVGVVLWSTTGTSGMQVINLLTKAASVTGVNVEFLASGYNTDSQLRDVENFLSKGVQGILICDSSEDVMVRVADMCNERGVYFAQMFRTLFRPEVIEIVESSPYFVGRSVNYDYPMAYKLGTMVAEKGLTKACITTGPRGDNCAEDRFRGISDAFKDHGVEVLAEQWEVADGTSATTAVQNFLTAYPEVEVIATMFSVEAITAAHTAIVNAGRQGEILIVAQDTTGYAEFDLGLVNNGEAIMSGGHILDPIFSYMLLSNAITGNKLSETPVNCVMEHIIFTPERAAVYFTQMEQGEHLLGFNEEEMAEMFWITNPNVTAQQLVDSAANWSVEDFLQRRGLPPLS